jgi:hypothetical protein
MDFETRYDFLKTSIARFDRYFDLAAVKGSLLLTSNAVFLANTVGRDSVWAANRGVATTGLTIGSGALSLISVALAALVIASYLTRSKGHPQRPSLAFTEEVARASFDDYRQGIADLSEDAIIDELAQLAHLLASNLPTKFRYVNLSLAALIGAIVTAFIGALLV